MGCDLLAWSKTQNLKFQSTHPCGVRRADELLKLGAVEVSIHAPVWGATGFNQWQICPACFNPRTRVGCDSDRSYRPIALLAFQSTHPCGVRRSLKTVSERLLMFQSTHPCGVRPRGCHLLAMFASFNPRTRVGCDVTTISVATSEQWFQSTHPCGVRLLCGVWLCQC